MTLTHSLTHSLTNVVAFVEDQLARYGMRGMCVVWFGGEPLLQPQLFDIMATVYARGMFVFEINTNGRFLIAQVLANIASFGFKPEMKISFNGLGFQDWMRGCEGAEQDALRAIKLCVDAGFPTRVQMNINRKNRDSILSSLALLDDMGVGRARVIPTTPSTRWEMNAQGQSLDWGEFFHNNWPNRFARVLAPPGSALTNPDGWPRPFAAFYARLASDFSGAIIMQVCIIQHCIITRCIMFVGRELELTRRQVVCQDLHGVEALEFASGPVCTQCRGPLRKVAIRMRF